MIDGILRACSFLVLGAIVHQVFLRRFAVPQGRDRHIWIGRLAVALGIAIAALITIRGLRYEGAFTPTYVLHLLTGGPFLVLLFATASLGRTLRTSGKRRAAHRLCAYFTVFFLVTTLMLGIATSFMRGHL